jgi:nucleotide-binding universal stress UspA family protein
VKDPTPVKPVLLCFDGSEHAAHAIATAGQLLGARPAVLVTVCEPTRLWSPSDPATILDAPIGKALAKGLKLDEIADEVARDDVDRGVELASNAGFRAQGRVVHGKPRQAICDVADELDAAVIVLGARGLTRIQSALLGSVSAAVSVHAGRPVLIVHQPTAPTKSMRGEHRRGRVIAAHETRRRRPGGVGP